MSHVIDHYTGSHSPLKFRSEHQLTLLLPSPTALALICSVGVNNDFLVKTKDTLAITYNDRSPMENHHAAAAWSLLLGDEDCAAFSNTNAKVRGCTWAGLARVICICVYAECMGTAQLYLFMQVSGSTLHMGVFCHTGGQREETQKTALLHVISQLKCEA
jgi:hypothetical protein